jgi:cathepsin L
MGCNGGMPGRALNFVEKNGITTEDKYAYKAVKGSCALKGGEYKNSGHKALDVSEEALLSGL